MTDLSARIRDLRKRAGWSQNRLEKEAGLSTGTISRYESGERGAARPDYVTVRKIAKALGVSAGDLLQTGDGDVLRLAEFRDATPALDQAIDIVREHVSLEAVERARVMASAARADLSTPTWVAVLTELDRQTKKS